MDRRYLGLLFFSLAMVVHAMAVGRYLGSLYFIVAFAWGWVAVAALRGRLDLAWDMGLTIMALLLLSLGALSYAAAGMQDFVALGSLVYFPAIISWACLLVYIRHLRNHDAREAGGGWDDVGPANAAAQFLKSLERGRQAGRTVQDNHPAPEQPATATPAPADRAA